MVRVRNRAGAALAGIEIDNKFTFLAEVDPALAPWQAWAAEYLAVHPNLSGGKRAKYALAQFFVNYMHGNQLQRLTPEEFVQAGRSLPDLSLALGAGEISESELKVKIDAVSDFFGWILRHKLGIVGTERRHGTSPALANPFPRTRPRLHRKYEDLDFRHVVELDPSMEDWRLLASIWLKDQKTCVGRRRDALDTFLIQYIQVLNLNRSPERFLLRRLPKPDFADVKVKCKLRGPTIRSVQDIVEINYVSDFLQWVLMRRCGDSNGLWDRSKFHNPVPRLSLKGQVKPTESTKSPLAFRYIKILRGLLAEGQCFRDWTWAQTCIGAGQGSDWVIVAPQLIDREDPDCVYRERAATRHEIKKLGYPARVVELWSPVRAMSLYILLELPLRKFQVRMLDSGEADTFRYVHGGDGGSFVPSTAPLATGTLKRPIQRGAFHRLGNEPGAGLYINTNKTADSGRSAAERGYVIPWVPDRVLYWLEKLRNWQERYNPIASRRPGPSSKVAIWGALLTIQRCSVYGVATASSFATRRMRRPISLSAASVWPACGICYLSD